VTTPAYSESASSGSDTFALSYLSHVTNIPDVELGFRQNVNIPLDSNWSVDFSDRLAWKDDMSGTWDAHATYAELPGSIFIVDGAQPAKSAALASLGLAFQSRFGLGVNFHLSGTVAGNSQTYEEYAGLSFAW
jgi:uncharacterized protein with beta-barrel porin domain